jgi:PAS domain-containing protein
MPNGRIAARCSVCETGVVLLATTKNVISLWPPAALYGAVAGVLVLGVLIGVVINRGRGHRAIAQRLTALSSRLAVEAHHDDGKVESALAYLEEVTGEAHNAVSESSAESTRLRRSLDSLPLGLVLCDETGGVIFRNNQAENLMASRYGDAIAAQAVTDVLAEGWASGVAERTDRHLRTAAANPHDSRDGHRRRSPFPRGPRGD